MLNPWVILAVVLSFGAVGSGAYIQGRKAGITSMEARAARENALKTTILEQAQLGAAKEIAKIKIVQTTIRQQAEQVIREKVVYRDCYNDTAVVGLLDAARAGTAVRESTGSGELPGAGAGSTSDVR